MKDKNSIKFCFGRGFRKVDPYSAVSFNPSLREKEIALEIDPVSKFCIEVVENSSGKCYRYRSDISMLLHAKDTAKKIGTEGLRYLSETRRTKSSDIQSQLDEMDDQLILDTIKSRHLQSPSEILAWSDTLTNLAHEIETRAGFNARELYEKELAAIAKSNSGDPSGQSDTSE